jgi:hypothetical protein
VEAVEGLLLHIQAEAGVHHHCVPVPPIKNVSISVADPDLEKTFVGVLKVMEENSRIRIRIFADPDPHQNVMDPQHLFPFLRASCWVGDSTRTSYKSRVSDSDPKRHGQVRTGMDSDPDPLYFWSLMIRIRFILESLIRIRIRVKSWIWFRIRCKVKFQELQRLKMEP